MNKKGVTLTEAAIALILVIIVVSFLITFGPKIWDSIGIVIGLTKFDTNDMDNEKPATQDETPPTENNVNNEKPATIQDNKNKEKPAASGGEIKKEIGTIPLVK